MNRLVGRMLMEGEVLAVTSATTFYSRAVSMEGVDEAAFMLTMPSALVGAGAAVVITIQQGANATVAESSNAAALTPACSTQIGSTVAYYIYKARAARVSFSSATTDGETIIINGTTYTVSTANAATSLQFGATAGSTGAGGETSACVALAALINSTVSSIGIKNVTATAATTYVDISVKDTASTYLNITTTGVHLLTSYRGGSVKISVKGDALNSTSKYLSAVISSCATAGAYGLSVIRRGSYSGKPEHGIVKIHKAT